MPNRGILLGLALLTGAFLGGSLQAAPPANFQNEVVIATGLTVPTALEFLPDGRMLIAEFTGRIVVVQPGASAIDPTPVMQLVNVPNEDIVAGGERGLVNVIADPNFTTNGYIYIFYTAGTPLRDRVSRFTMVGNTASLATEFIIWQGIAVSATTNHHGGGLLFGPDGKLYISTGDDSDAASCQLLTSEHGKMLRYNPDGTVPTDNPFYDGAGPNIDSIWALGLRNPYRMSLDVPTGRIYIGDVGWDTTEEVNVLVRGANYGWPIAEGPSSTSGLTNPIYSYPHNGRDACVAGGFVYRGTQFPVSYRGVYFFGDYAQNWIKTLTLDASGNVTGSANFDPTNGALDTAAVGDPVMFKMGPDGSIYYVDFGWSPAENVATIRRIRYTAANQPPVAVVSSTVSGPPRSVNFSSAGSFDPEGQTLSYLWTFGDGTTSTAANPTHVYLDDGLYIVRLALSDGTNTTQSDIINVSIGNRPVGTIEIPVTGQHFHAGDTIYFSGTATDIEDGVLPASAYSWTVLFHHDSHVHPVLTGLTGLTSSGFTISSAGHDFDDGTNYEIVLTVTDSDGLQHASSVFVYPELTTFTLDSLPSGLSISVDGINETTPYTREALVGFQYNISAPNQSNGGFQYDFVSWSDGGAQSHVLTVPETPQVFTATFSAVASPTPPNQVMALSFNEGSGIAAADDSGAGHGGTLTNGPTWIAGKYGNGVSLDGTNDYVAVANSTTLNFGTADFTVATWVKRQATGTEHTIFSKTAASSWTTGGKEFFISGSDNTLAFGAYGGVGEVHSTGTILNDGLWHHVAATFVDSSNAMTLYIDGVARGNGTLNLPADGSGHVLKLGTNPGPSGVAGYYRGQLDDFRVFNRALSASEIQTVMNNPSSPSPADTTPPVLSGGLPTGTLAAGTTQATLTVTSNENANLRYSSTPGTPYASMGSAFSTTGGTSHSTTVTGLSNGSTYTYYVRSSDAAGNANTVDYAITFSVASPPADTTAPTVTITAPTNGATVSGSVTVSANAADNVGVTGVQFLLDGNVLGAEDTNSPYSVTWDTLPITGSHVLTARARDAANNQTTSATVTVNVDNSSPPNQIVAFSLSEGSGTSTTDNSGSGHTGTLTNGPTWITGKYGSGVSMDGSNDYVLVANPSTLNFGTSNFTFAAWIRRQTSGAEHTIFSKAANSSWSSGAKEFFINAADGRLGFGRNGGSDVFSTGSVTNDGLWHHVAVTFVDSSNTLAFYIDGVASGGGTSNLPADNSSHVVKVGGHPSGHTFNGAMDEIRIFSRTLSLAEIQSIMNSPLVNPPADTTPPTLSNGQPTGTLAAGTTQVTLSVATNENSTLRYSTTPGTAYAAMSSTFATSGGISHSTTIAGLTNGNTYTYYVRGVDAAGNATTSDFMISFAIASPPVDTTPPSLSNGQPAGTLPIGTTQATLTLTSSETATARYSTTAGTAYASMGNTFTTTGGTSHSTTVSGLTNGTTYTYYVRSIDGAGNANTSDYIITFSVASDTTAPVLSNGQPTGTLAAGTTQATLAVTTNESATLRYSTTPGTTYAAMSNTFTTTGATSHSSPVSGLVSGNTYTYYVRGIDAVGNATTSDFVISFSVAAPADTTPPTVNMTAPADGATISGSGSVSASASDNIGVIGVQFLLDGSSLGAEDTTAPYSITWDTTTASAGTHTLSARARDAAGNQSTSAVINVTVSNSAIPANQVTALLFNESSGTAAADTSGSGHGGTLTNGPTWVAGKYGNSVSLDGTNDYVAVANSNTLNLGTANFTVTAWVKRQATGTEHTIFSKTAASSWTTGGKEFFISGSDNTLAFGGYGSVGEVHATGTITNDGLWHHVAVTFVDSSNAVTLYIDGVARGTGTLNLPADGSSHVIKLGTNPGPSGVAGYYRGLIDEFRIFSRALSASEIQTVMNSQL